MVVIRLARGGRKHRPVYRITVSDSRRWAGGRYIDVIGQYNPTPQGQEQGLVLNLEKANEWIAKGAQPSERVRKLMKAAEEAQKS